ncbi:unnamed protein product [Amoebophrya sp. A25]|nr:unnamed protein product [Amoebophrya sp. A25]|eukprot:GSA25T00021145001.1
MITANMMGPLAVLLLSFSLVFATEVKERGNFRGSSFLDEEEGQQQRTLKCSEHPSTVETCYPNWPGDVCGGQGTGEAPGTCVFLFGEVKGKGWKGCICKANGVVKMAASKVSAAASKVSAAASKFSAALMSWKDEKTDAAAAAGEQKEVGA